MVERVDASTYSEGVIGSQLIASVVSDSVDAFSSHSSPIEKKNPIRKIGMPPKIVKTIWATAVASVLDEVKTAMVTQTRPMPNTNNPIPIRQIMTRQTVIRIVSNIVL